MTVSVCIVAYNEEQFLPSLFNDINSQTYPHELTEIILINSASTDNTLKLMNEFKESSDFSSVKVIENKKKIQAAGWNLAIMNAENDVIIRIDAHTHIPKEFVEKNMLCLKNGEYVSGGKRPCLIENDTAWGRTLLQVENSLFGSSINKCRRDAEKSYVKTMFHAAYRKEVFEKAGGFNENLLRTEDNEMHYRIRKSGYKLCFDPEIISYQYARSNLKRMLKQKYGNGLWIGLTLGVAPGCISLYHLIPFAFVLAIIFTSLLAFLGFWQLSVLMWSAYGVFAVANTIISITQNKFSIHSLLMPFLFLILHISYGIGSFIGIIRMPFKREKLKNCPEINLVKERLKNNTEKVRGEQ